MKLTVEDIIVRSRDIEVPKKCPKCGADLTQEGSMKVWEYQDQSRFCHIINDTVEWETDQPDSGESWLACSYECHSCGHVLAFGTEQRINTDDSPQTLLFDGVQATLADSFKAKADVLPQKELAEELLGERTWVGAEPDEDPVNHIEVLRHHLIGGYEATIDLVEELCKKVLGRS